MGLDEHTTVIMESTSAKRQSSASKKRRNETIQVVKNCNGRINVCRPHRNKRKKTSNNNDQSGKNASDGELSLGFPPISPVSQDSVEIELNGSQVDGSEGDAFVEGEVSFFECFVCRTRFPSKVSKSGYALHLRSHPRASYSGHTQELAARGLGLCDTPLVLVWEPTDLAQRPGLPPELTQPQTSGRQLRRVTRVACPGVRPEM